jgi:hypothetical protein
VTFADNGRGQGGHGPEQGARPDRARPVAHQEKAHGPGASHAAMTCDEHVRHEAADADAPTEPEDEGAGEQVGVCHATGDGTLAQRSTCSPRSNDMDTPHRPAT